MEQFKYKARKRDGAVVYGTVNAPNEAAVAAFIRKQDMYVAGIEASKKKNYFFNIFVFGRFYIFMRFVEVGISEIVIEIEFSIPH